MKKILLFLLPFYLTFHLHAQKCGTVATQETIDYFNKVHGDSRLFADGEGCSALSSAVFLTIPIKFHAIKNSANEGGMSAAKKDMLINRLNGYFAPAKLGLNT